jgi:protein-tyrosine-phosphatase
VRAEARGERALAKLARGLAAPLGRLLALGPLRGWLHRRAVTAWDGGSQPLILCYGNINRSPFAAGLARQGPAPSASSGGLYTQEGRPSPPTTVRVAQERGVGLAEHRSHLTTRDQLLTAPAIFVFDLENVVRVGWRAPLALRRVHLWACLAAAGPALIEDPHARGEQALNRAFDQIEGALDAVRPAGR